jgi:class 3 adenylate cyclase
VEQKIIYRLETVLYWLLPQLRIKGRNAFRLWKEEENKLFETSAVSYLILCACLYISAYYLIDIPSNKQPLQLYTKYRFGIFFSSLIGATLIFALNKTKPFLSRIAFFIFSGNIVFWQSQSMIWKSDVPYFYVFIFATLGVNFSRSSPLISGLTYVFFLALCLPAFDTRPNEQRFIISLAIVGFVFVISLRSRMVAEISAFMNHQESLESQRGKIEAQIELSDSIKSFLPREVYSRFTHLIDRGQSTRTALNTILKPRRAIVACLYSDIRGFTKRIRENLDLAESAIFPSQEMAMQNVENCRGIPRPVGDLVFGYFDHSNARSNVIMAVHAAFNIIEGQKTLNSSQEKANIITRYALVSYGLAVVGNGGGKYSSRDIYPVGSPSNILSRIDELSKELKHKELIDDDHLILSHEAGAALVELLPELDVIELHLKNFSLVIRDFPEEHSVFLSKPTSKNKNLVSALLRTYED